MYHSPKLQKESILVFSTGCERSLEFSFDSSANSLTQHRDYLVEIILALHHHDDVSIGLELQCQDIRVRPMAVARARAMARAMLCLIGFLLHSYANG